MPEKVEKTRCNESVLDIRIFLLPRKNEIQLENFYHKITGNVFVLRLRGTLKYEKMDLKIGVKIMDAFSF